MPLNESLFEQFILTMLDGSSDAAAPVVQLDARSLQALSDTLTPMILECVQRSLPTSQTTAREATPCGSRQTEDDSITLYPEHDDLADSESVSDDTSAPGSIVPGSLLIMLCCKLDYSMH